MIIQHNLAAMTASRMNITNNRKRMKSIERLSSGYRVNRAADDAAALSISEKMRSQIRGLQRAEDNVQDGFSYVQVADGALGGAHEILHRMRELAVQAANDTNTEEDRAAIDNEVQELKDELDRIFEETEFNTKKIWDTETDNKIQIGTESRQAVTMQTSSKSFRVTETNKGAIAYSGYTIEVKGTDPDDPDNYGFVVKWEGWNKNEYSTNLISWDDVEVGTAKSFGFNIKDYVDTTAHPELAGIEYQIGWRMEETATIDDVAASINGVYFSTGVSSSESVKVGTSVPGVSYSISTNYLAELAADRNVESYDTDWIEPALTGGSNVTSTPSYTSTTEDAGWTIEFEMQNIGKVIASSANVSYSSNDYDDDDLGHWWYWVKNSQGANSYRSSYTYTPSVGSAGTLHGVTDVITNSGGKLGNNGKKGISLTDNAENGGQITLRFNMVPEDASQAKYCDRDVTSVGSLYVYINVYDDDTEETLMNRVYAALNDNAVIDAYHGSANSGSPSSTSHTIYSANAKTHKIDVPVYQATINLKIQAGANEGQTIDLTYESLRTMNLGVGDVNVLTQRDAAKAITAVQAAEEIVSEQRSLFGAYQNRFEYAMEMNANAAENLQHSESKLRDLDMAEEAMNNAKLAILEQASQSMLSHANQQTDSILQLISG